MTQTPATLSSSLRNLLLVATGLAVILLMASAFPLSMSPAIFDSGQSFATWAIFLGLWLMPVLLIAGIGIAWLGAVRSARKIVVGGLVLAALPVLAAAGVIVMAG